MRIKRSCLPSSRAHINGADFSRPSISWKKHSLPDSKLERLYREVDWPEIAAEDPQYIAIRGMRVPYVVLDNSDDVTTARAEALGDRLELTLQKLWPLYAARH